LALVMSIAAALLLLPQAGRAAGSKPPPHWVNHDDDGWGGWSGSVDAANPQGCDPIDPGQGMLPYPNDWFTPADPTSHTGRRLVTDDGSVAKATPAFAGYRDGTAPASDPRTAHYGGIFADLSEAGWSTKDLFLAWDFTTASTQNVTGRLLAIRDDAFAQLGET